MSSDADTLDEAEELMNLMLGSLRGLEAGLAKLGADTAPMRKDIAAYQAKADAIRAARIEAAGGHDEYWLQRERRGVSRRNRSATDDRRRDGP
jgi:hypothetical protein